MELIDRRKIPNGALEGHWLAADGHEIRRIDLAFDKQHELCKGSILFLPGRGDHYEKYLEALQEWSHLGWKVTASDWRGQAASGRLGSDDLTGHIECFSTWISDLAQLWVTFKEVSPAPHILAGHSMGGHLVLRALAEKAVDPDAVILSAPMLGFYGPLPSKVGHFFSRLMCKVGDSKRPAWHSSEKPGAILADRQALLTHDDSRYQDELWWRQKRPELVMGPASWGWVESAFASMKGLEKPGTLETVDTPILFIATSNDKLVCIKAINDAVSRLPLAELIKFGSEAHHEILREVDEVRSLAMEGIIEFLEGVVSRS